MNITELLSAERVICDTGTGSKKRLLEYLGELLADYSRELAQNEVFNALVNREKLGSTGLGKGVAIPHGRITGLDKPVCAFIKLESPIDFDATDDRGVDLVCALLVPEDSTEEHLQVLSTIAEVFSNQGVCTALRECRDSDCLFEKLHHWEAQRLSA